MKWLSSNVRDDTVIQMDSEIQPNEKMVTDRYQKKWEKLYDCLEIGKRNSMIYLLCKLCQRKNPFANGKLSSVCM